MDAYSFTSFVNQIAQLTRAQCKHVLALLRSTVNQARTFEVIDEAAAATLCCPRRQATQLYRNGTELGLQRFRRRDFGRTLA